jgi:hypothetical protein
MMMNRDAGAVRLPSHMGLRPMGAPTQPTVDDALVVNMPRVNPAVAAAMHAVGALHSTAFGVTS